MSFFSQFKDSSTANLNPRIAFTAALFLTIFNDQAFMQPFQEYEEWDFPITDDLLDSIETKVRPYLKAFGDDLIVEELLTGCNAYFQETRASSLLRVREIAEALTPEQRLTTLVNICDLILSDGVVDEVEEKCQQRFKSDPLSSKNNV
jgi:hypothetical protein